MYRYIVPISILIFCFIWACRPTWEIRATTEADKRIVPYKPYTQATDGNPDAGFQYMIYGDLVGNGVPYDVHTRFFPAKPDTVLRREGLNGGLPYHAIAFERGEDVTVVSGNCFSCHAQKLNGQLILGLGNSFSDYTRSSMTIIRGFNWMVKLKYGKKSPEWAVYKEQAKWYEAIGHNLKMTNQGLNPAFRLEEAAVAYRNPTDLTYQDSANFEPLAFPVGTDVPPLWHAQKKGMLYYNGVGRGDFTKLLMQASVLGVHDSTKARDIQQHFADVLAWINTIEPPTYPGEIDRALAAEGELLFAQHCEECHGSYGEKEFYPNKIIPLPIIQTDSAYAIYNLKTPLFDWYNQSWFAQTDPPSMNQASYGYMAPPLDGIWATAPYLHNGSVPDLWSLLDSKARPTYWQRTADSEDYNMEKVGWNYTARNNSRGKWTYDTTLPGSSHVGHYFGDTLSTKERWAMIEYLKTL
ncbi:MAG: hypothetical protein AAFP89_24660 [Bacteroidota bacterium]